jgi:hypothetical protein
VRRWDQQEPFGNNVPDENPSGIDVFDLPLRRPGQYFDKGLRTRRHENESELDIFDNDVELDRVERLVLATLGLLERCRTYSIKNSQRR